MWVGISSLHRADRAEGECFHWENIFNKLKENEEISNEDVTKLATEYALKGEAHSVNIKEDPMDLTFCNNIDIIYTPDKINPISNLLYGFELFSISHLNFKKESIVKEQHLNTEISSKSLELKEILAQEKLLKDKINKYENSLSWRITSPLRKIGKMIRDLNK